MAANDAQSHALLRFLLAASLRLIHNPHHHHARRRGVAKPQPGYIPIRRNYNRRTLSRSQPIHYHDRLRSRASIGFQPLPNQEPAAIQSRMLDCRDYGALDARQKHDYTIRNALPTTICRSRVKVSGVVTPSPVGVAMLWLKYPGPPTPSEAGEAAL